MLCRNTQSYNSCLTRSIIEIRSHWQAKSSVSCESASTLPQWATVHRATGTAGTRTQEKTLTGIESWQPRRLATFLSSLALRYGGNVTQLGPEQASFGPLAWPAQSQAELWARPTTPSLLPSLLQRPDNEIPPWQAASYTGHSARLDYAMNWRTQRERDGLRSVQCGADGPLLAANRGKTGEHAPPSEAGGASSRRSWGPGPAWRGW